MSVFKILTFFLLWFFIGLNYLRSLYYMQCTSVNYTTINVRVNRFTLWLLHPRCSECGEHISFLPLSRRPSRVICLILPFLWPFHACYKLQLLIRQCFHLEGQSGNGTPLNLEMRFWMLCLPLRCIISPWRWPGHVCVLCSSGCLV